MLGCKNGAEGKCSLALDSLLGLLFRQDGILSTKNYILNFK